MAFAIRIGTHQTELGATARLWQLAHLLPLTPTPANRVDFPAKEVPYSRVRPNHQLAPAEGPFVDATTMRTDYPGWMGAKPSTPAHGRAVSVPRGVGPFEGLSSYKVRGNRGWERMAREAGAGQAPAGEVGVVSADSKGYGMLLPWVGWMALELRLQGLGSAAARAERG